LILMIQVIMNISRVSPQIQRVLLFQSASIRPSLILGEKVRSPRLLNLEAEMFLERDRCDQKGC